MNVAAFRRRPAVRNRDVVHAGPDKPMLASAGARFGFARTWRHQLGIVVAAGFQWINPKAWHDAPATATYSMPKTAVRLQIALLTLTFAVMGVASSST